MKKFRLRYITVACALAMPAVANELKAPSGFKALVTQPTIMRNVATDSESAKAGQPIVEARSVYIVQLEDKPVATYEGGIARLAATSNRMTGAKKLNVHSKKSKAYRSYLKKKQNKLIAASGISGKVKFDYQLVFNGLAVEMTAQQAKAMSGLPGVVKVSRERVETLNTDSGPAQINAGSIWGGPPNNVPHSRGENIVIAVLDTGISHNNPSFADIGADGYDHNNPLGSGNYLPGSYCDTVDATFCNDKLIGAWSFVTGPSDPNSPEDSDGHGSHTAGTSAGNVLTGATINAPTTSISFDIAGVAPHANIIAYDVCIETCPGSALLAAINQVVVDAAALPDGIHALNYSISGGGDPYNDPVELGFLNASAAGVFVATSAGNDGPGASTNGHNSPWVSTVAAMTHDRKLVNAAIDLSSDDSSLSDIEGLGFTSGYGPARVINSADLEAEFPGSTLCGVGSIGDFNPPWPAGTFNGEIVACTRGTFGRVEKGVNALAAGAGGYILMDNGAGLVGDAHALPAVHISQADGEILAGWLASNDNPMATIAGVSAEKNDANADILAGFSSRGPNETLDIIKPDIGAPGVSIFAANRNDGESDFQFLSGTSMSSPHTAGAGAIVSGARPDWTPYQVKSAIMMTANSESGRKEDGATAADPFDMGAGRVDLARAVEADLVLDESPQNFLIANPDVGGDPKTLNIASMQDGSCLAECSWSRTLTNVTHHTVHVDLSVATDSNVGFTVSPSSLKIKKGQSASFTVTADSTLASDWNFAQLDIKRTGDGPDLHMPLAVQAIFSTAPELFIKSVDKSEALEGEVLNYQLDISNGQLDGIINLKDVLPEGVDFVAGSLSETVTNGTTVTPFAKNGNELSWSGTLATSGMALADIGWGYLPLANFFAPSDLPANCDDGGIAMTVPEFFYNGTAHTSVIWSVNGTLEAGTASGIAASASNKHLPNTLAPNNLMAPWWTDLNLCAGGNWYVGRLSGGGSTYTVYEWENVPLFSDSSVTATFQIWVIEGTGNIIFAYNDVAGGTATVGIENETGTVGDTRYFNGEGTLPSFNNDLLVTSTPGGSASLGFKAIANCQEEVVVNKAEISNDNKSVKAIASTKVNGC